MSKHPPDQKQVLAADATATTSYQRVLTDVAILLTTARQMAARTINAVMTSTYWEIGHRIVEYEQGGQTRAEYGEKIIERLSIDLTRQFGRGFSVVNLRSMRRFYLEWPQFVIQQTPSVESECEVSMLKTNPKKCNVFHSHGLTMYC